ncbi:MAG: hypothetical protein M1587_05545 [Thaumarchaeota archaeon]|nr:hypothetical protein [Nitrososphaerota archaeon]
MTSKSKTRSKERYVEAYSWTDDGRFVDAPKASQITVLSCTRYKGCFWFIVADPFMKRKDGPDVVIVEPDDARNLGFSCNVHGPEECVHITAARAFIADRPQILED